MAHFSISDVQIAGIAAAVPRNEVSNWDYDRITEQERKLLVKTTGVEKRRVAPKGLATSDLCFAAAEELLKELNWDRSGIEILIFLSQSRDYYLPSTAIILQDRLGLSKHCVAFDIGLGCSGYVYGMSVISSMMSAAGMKKGLLMMGDVSSATCSIDDKSTYPLFGDAGTTTALEVKPGKAPMHFHLKNDGSGYKAIMIPDGGIRNLVSPDSFIKETIEPGIIRDKLNLSLNGLDVFNFSITEVPQSLKDFFDKTGTDHTSYDYFVMHQANKLMNETIRKKLKFEPHQVPYSLAKFGNTSSASIPLTIVTEMNEAVKTRSLRLLLAGFGVGLSWGIMSLETDPIACPSLIEI